MNYQDRSFYIDEAMLSYSLSERTIWKLIASPFEWGQIAPIGYLYLCKIIILIFGNTEFVLRSISIFSYMTVIVMVYIISNKIFSIKYSMLCSAFVANTPFMITFSNEFKQYMFEAAVILILFYIYYLYKSDLISWGILITLFAIIIWLANPSIFFICAILLWEGMHFSKKTIKCIIFALLFLFISFISYYIFWLQSAALNDAMQVYWKDSSFRIVITNIKDFEFSRQLIESLFNLYFLSCDKIILILVTISIIMGIYKKNHYIIITILSIALLLVASSINHFPIAGRLCLFLIPFFTIMVFSTLENFLSKNISLIIMLFLLIHIHGIRFDIHSLFPHPEQNDPNTIIEYLIKNVKKDEMVFVDRWSIPVMKYKIGYHTNNIGDASTDNIIWAQDPPFRFTGPVATFKLTDERKSINLKKVLEAKKCYIMYTHSTSNKDVFYMLQATAQHGFLEMIFDNDINPLYFYTNDIQYIKQNAEYKIVKVNNSYDSCELTIMITNIGNTYINGTIYDEINFTSRERSDVIQKIMERLKPNENIELVILFNWRDNETYIDLQLMNAGKFWFDELGCPPLRIVRPHHDFNLNKQL